jgi:hypothetical protein
MRGSVESITGLPVLSGFSRYARVRKIGSPLLFS